MMTDEPPESFEARFDDLAAVAYRVAYRLLGEREAARDVTQEALSRGYARWDRVADYAEPWVARVAGNLALGHLRRAARRAPIRAHHVDDETAGFADRHELVEALSRLSRRQREVMVLRYVADLSEADVAASIGCSIGAVKQHSHRARQELRSVLTAGTHVQEGQP